MCGISVVTRYELLKHYRLKHCHQGSSFRHPCPFANCPCKFRLFRSLLSHVYRSHQTQTSSESSGLTTFACQLCTSCEVLNEHDFFSHINEHLQRYETVTCVFKDYVFETNIYSTFHSHKNRKHKPYTLNDFKAEVETVNGQEKESPALDVSCASDTEIECETGSNCNIEDLQKLIEQKIASVLLKLEYILFVPATAIDEVLHDLHFLLTSSAVPITFDKLSNTLKDHSIQVDESVVKELSQVVCKSNPLAKAFA